MNNELLMPDYNPESKGRSNLVSYPSPKIRSKVFAGKLLKLLLPFTAEPQ